MPELPDVEIFRRYFDATSLRKKIDNVEVKNKKVLKGVGAKKLNDRLGGSKFKSTIRHGKNMLVRVKGGLLLRLHFGMTGRLEYSKSNEPPDHARVMFHFANGYTTYFINQRLLGRVSLEKSVEHFVESNDLGPDFMELDKGEFIDIVKGRRGSLKTTLMNQSIIAGLGNVYTDETLFQAGFLPKKKFDELGEKEIGKIYTTARRIVETAINNEADPSRFPRTYLTPRRKKGEDCPKCGGKISKIYVSGRPTYFCGKCQK